MSRIGDNPIDVPAGVTVSVNGVTVSVKGPKGESSMDLPGTITAAVEDTKVVVKRQDDTRGSKSFHGLSRSLIANMIEGVEKGYSKELEIQGVGFKAQIQGKKMLLSLGFASAKEYLIPDTVSITEDGGTKIVITGIDKQQVGLVAARIRSYYPPEPYKGKGIRYKGEHVRRKVGKTVA